MDQTSSPDFLKRLKAVKDEQTDALKVLGPLYKSGVSHCRVVIVWGESKKTEVSGSFGEAQVLTSIEAVLGDPK